MDWDAVIEGAKAHRILPVLYSAIRDRPGVSQEAMERLKGLVKMQQVHSLGRVALLLDLIALFGRQGIPVIALKGPVLARELYGHHWFRDSADIDLLLREDDIESAAHLLVAWGYNDRLAHQHPHRRALAHRIGCELELDNVDTRKRPVELHWRLAPESVACMIGVEEIWSRARTVEFMKRSVQVMGPEDLLMYLCVHGSKHDWVNLILVCDLVRTVQTFPDLDWQRFMEISARASAYRRVAVGLTLAHRLLGVPLPASVTEWVSADRCAVSMASTIEWYIRGGGSSWPPPWGARFQPRSLDGWRSRARYWRSSLRLMLEPSDNMMDTLRLPTPLFALYYLAAIGVLGRQTALTITARVRSRGQRAAR
jgi:hypothetical protein